MQPQLQRLEIEALSSRDHDLAVHHAAVRQRTQKDVVQLGKVAIERPQIAALDGDLPRRAEDDGSEAVPLGLVEETLTRGQRLGGLGEHRLDGWGNDEVSHEGPAEAGRYARTNLRSASIRVSSSSGDVSRKRAGRKRASVHSFTATRSMYSS